MRMMPTRYVDPKPARAKPLAPQIAHISAPLKGLNLSSKLTTGDPLTAPILTNFVIEDDRITMRSGTQKLATMAGTPAIETLVPWYGPTPKMLAAGGGNLFNAATGASIRAGFTGNDWSWTSFANLGQQKFTVMCNGRDGVWSWDGSLVPGSDPGAVTVTSLSNSNPAKCTVALADIVKFQNGMTVVIAGATGTGMTVANGAHAIANVSGTTFELVGVNTSSGSAPQTTGVTADPPAPQPITKETVTAPPTETWINPDRMNIVLAHMNRLWFADTDNLAVYYLPLQAKSGALSVLPLNALFRRGGTIRAMYSWTRDGGVGLDDQLVIFSSNGECVIYRGVNPDAEWQTQDFQLVGIFRFDAPMSKHAIVNYGGDLYVLISTGLVPMSTLLQSESEQLGQIDRAVISLFLAESIKYRDRQGWAAFINPSSNRVFCNIPQGHANGYMQMVRHMPRPVWSQFQDVPARCWGWIDPYVYLGDDSGNVFRMHPEFRSDDGKAIRIDVQPSWSAFRTAGIKHFKMVKIYTISDGIVRPFVDVKTDYDLTPPEMQPDVSTGTIGATWDLADWDSSYWASGPMPASLWNGVGRLGRVGAPRFTASIKDCQFSITGIDVLFEVGAAI